MNLPTVPGYPHAVGDRRTAEPVTIPVRPGVSTVSYAGPSRDEIAERLPRARAQHATALAAARRARTGDLAAWARAMRSVEWSRIIIAQLLGARRALDVVWFDRSWFYFDDPELARRDALRGKRAPSRFHAARSRGDDITYIERRRAARVAARRARRTPERNAALDRAAAERARAYFDRFDY